MNPNPADAVSRRWLPRRWPLWPTLIAAAAVATMIGLCFWQIERGRQKAEVKARYAAAATLPPIGWPAAWMTSDRPLYRRANGFCLEIVERRAVAGSNRQSEPGFAILARCRTGADGAGMTVELGWSKDPSAGAAWRGGPVNGIIAPDRVDGIRLVSSDGLAGLLPSAIPDVGAIADNHRLYAIQWALFAGLAALIYVAALRRRELDADKAAADAAGAIKAPAPRDAEPRS